jgi:hypothetical protein
MTLPPPLYRPLLDGPQTTTTTNQGALNVTASRQFCLFSLIGSFRKIMPCCGIFAIL